MLVSNQTFPTKDKLCARCKFLDDITTQGSIAPIYDGDLVPTIVLTYDIPEGKIVQFTMCGSQYHKIIVMSFNPRLHVTDVSCGGIEKLIIQFQSKSETAPIQPSSRRNIFRFGKMMGGCMI